MFGLPFRWFLPMIMTAAGGGIVAAQNMGAIEEGIAHNGCKKIGWYWNSTSSRDGSVQRSWKCIES